MMKKKVFCWFCTQEIVILIAIHLF